MVYNHIIEHVLCAVSPIQFGFVQGRCTTPQLLLFLNFIHKAISHGHQVDTVYLDSGRLVQHSQLLTKLWNVGICGSLWRWFGSYLTDRRQCVRIFITLSDALPVLLGAPQGSILGPVISHLW